MKIFAPWMLQVVTCAVCRVVLQVKRTAKHDCIGCPARHAAVDLPKVGMFTGFLVNLN